LPILGDSDVQLHCKTFLDSIFISHSTPLDPIEGMQEPCMCLTVMHIEMSITEYRIPQNRFLYWTSSVFRIRFNHKAKLHMINLFRHCASMFVHDANTCCTCYHGCAMARCGLIAYYLDCHVCTCTDTHAFSCFAAVEC